MIHELSIASIKQVASSFKRKYGFKCNVQGLAPVYMHHTMPDSQDKDEFTGTIIHGFLTNPNVLSN